MESLDHKLNNFLESLLGPRDPRVQGWLLLDNYSPTFALTLVYLLIVWAGPKYMRRRPALACRELLVCYNTGLTLLSLYMFYQLLSTAWHGGYNLFCQDTHSAGPADTKIMSILWWYYFSKLVEFMDTFFFILRKNNHQISFLHVYHHASMFNIWWFVMNWIPCGHTFFGPCINSLVHVVMYSYYLLSAIPVMRPFLWWKKYITQFQLVQFCITVLQTSSALVWPCGFPLTWLLFLVSYMITLVLFFSNFYLQAYKKNKDTVSRKMKSFGSTNGKTNSDPEKVRVD